MAISELLGLSVLEPGDVAALHDRVTTLLDDRRLARRMGDAGRAAALDRFTWSARADRYLGAYREVVS